MKKYFLSIVALAGMLFATSCQESLVEPQVGGTTTFTVQVPDQMGTKAIGDASIIDRLYVAVYENFNENGGTLPTSAIYKTNVAVVNGAATVALNLIQGQKYDIVFWAQNGESYVDADDELLSIPMDKNFHNNEAGAAFFHFEPNFDPTQIRTKGIELRRPFAQLNLGTTEASLNPATGAVSLVSSEIKIKGLAQTFNTITGMGETSTTELVTYAAAVPDNWQKLSAANHEYVYVSMDYLPIVGDAKAVFDIEANIVVKDNSGNKTINHKFASVPVQENYRTNIVGNLISSTTDFNVSIDSEFDGTYEGNFDGLVVDGATRTITVLNTTGLLGLSKLNTDWVRLFSNGQGTDILNYFDVNGGKGADYYYKWEWTIKLESDIDFKDQSLTAPINISTWGVFDGQGHTIKNVNITTGEAAGLFIASKAIKIMNLKLDDVHVTGSLVGNSTAGILASDCNGGIDNITITNSSVWGGKYTGGIVGYGYTYVTNCTLTNCVIKGGYKLGGVIGYICASNKANAHDVTGCTLTDCTVSGTDGQYADNKSQYIIGKVVGNYNCNGSCSNNTITNMATEATNIIGKIETGKNVTIENNVVGISVYGLTLIPDGQNSKIIVKDKEGFLNLTKLFADWTALFSNDLGKEITDFFVENGGKGADYYYSNRWTISLEADIDLNNSTISPVILKHPGGTGAPTFDGKNHTIKNARIVTDATTENTAGLFDASNCNLKNLKLDNIHVTGSNKGNSNAGILSGFVSANVQNITIINSSVTGGKYTGGIIGSGYTDVTNCSLTNVTVKGGYKLGGVIGYICASSGTGDVIGNTLTGCTVNGIGGGVYAGGKTEYIMGKVVGHYNCNGTCSNNTVEAMTTDATEIIGLIQPGMTVTIE